MPSAAENITRHYNGDWHGSYGTFPSPGHGKSDRGMSVKDGDNGDVLFNSFNGGDPLAVKDECRKHGLLPEREQRAPGGGWRETGHYEYLNGDGKVAYRTVRKEKTGERKRFVAQRPDGRGGWINGLGDADRILYRLPEIKRAIGKAVLKDAAPPVLYLTEGERKADKLASWGLLATAIAFGANGWRQGYADDLEGFTVVILPDNDDEGRKFADKAAQAINAIGSRAVILALPDLPAKGDIIDWRGDADQLRALTDEALRDPKEAPQAFDLADLNAWAATAPTPKAFVMAPFIPRDDVVIITGDGGTNKSTLALQVSACAAAGRQFLGLDVAPGPALYITAEDDQRENHWRLTKIATIIGTTLNALAGRLFVASLRGRLNNELATFDADGKLRPSPAFLMLRQTIISTGAKLVTLDNVAHLYAGNENDRGQVTAFINLLYQLCGDLGVTVLLIAHRNKSGDSYSGSTAWLNAVRSQVLLERSNEHDADERSMSLGKANYARAGETAIFRWHDFALIRNDDLPPEQRSEIAANVKAASDNAIFLACLTERNGQRRQVSEKPTAANYAPKQFEGMPQAKGLSKKRLIDAMDRLYRAGAIERGYLYRDTAEGKDIHGLRETGKVPETSPETSRKQHPEGSGNPQGTTGNTHPISKDNPGAAHGSAAPSPSTTILAPGETGDEPVPGWE